MDTTAEGGASQGVSHRSTFCALCVLTVRREARGCLGDREALCGRELLELACAVAPEFVEAARIELHEFGDVGERAKA